MAVAPASRMWYPLTDTGCHSGSSRSQNATTSATSRIEREARQILERIDADGGVLAAIERGTIQRDIQESAYRTQTAIDAGEQVVVGVNRFTDDSEASLDVFRLDPEVEHGQIQRLRALRASRSEDAARTALAAVEQAARGSDNLVPPIIDAVQRSVTLGEIADTLRGVFGEHREATGV